jgi:diguanylate cyclase (GGDEF)-like protein/PAS domain S-box-containing protein
LADNHNMADLGRNNPGPTDGLARRAYENGRAKSPSGDSNRWSERWLLSVLQNTSDVVTIVDADGTVCYASPSIERMLGYEPRERVGRSCFELLHPDDLPRARSTFAEALRKRGGMLPALGVRMRDRGGTWRQVEVTGQNLLDDPSVRGIAINWRDVTDYRRAERALKESEQRFGSAFRDAAIGMALVAPDGRFLQVNRSLSRILGYPEGELLGKNFREITHPEDLESDVEQVRRMLSGEIETYQKEKRYFHEEGHVVWILLSVSLVHDEAGEPLYFVSQLQDVTERKLAEERLRRAEARYRALVERMPAVVYIQEIGGPESAMYMSPQIEALTGYTTDECKDPDLRWRMVHPGDRERLRAEDERTVEPGQVYTNEYRVVHRDGRTIWVRNESVVVEDEESGTRYWQGFMVDITERKALGERLHHQAFHDPLTDLPNRALFVDRLDQALKHTRRRPGRKVAVLFMDLDDFKVVNDSLGHEVGNRLLVAVGERLKGCIRPEDTLARFGGDEFTVLIEDVEKPEDAVGLAERSIEVFRGPFALEGRELFIKPSIGIAVGEARTKSPEDLLRDADTAMYRAKEGGIGYRVFEPIMYEQTLRRLKLENDMRRAIEAEEFVVRYQPIVDLRSAEAWGMEALVRWQHPEKGLLDPKEFVPGAEESGLVVPMGERVLKEACHWAKEWQERCPHTPPLTMSVNLSARQLHRPDLVKIVEETLEETKLGARCLCLDITETACIGALKDHGAALNKLKRLGVCISIDDFGTGYSSLAYLKRLPADALKIDKAFVSGLGEDAEDTAIVRMIIDLAHTLGMRIIAEGVESEEQAEQLKEMGCDLGQGYHFAEPLPPEEVSEYLAR